MKYELHRVAFRHDGAYFSLDIHGVRFAVDIASDNTTGPPWEECDGHGPVRSGEGKHPGERLLGTSEHYRMNQYFYDWAEATKIAARDSWGVAPDRRPANWESLTAKQRAALAVQHDFEFLRGWVNGDWQYLTVGTALRPPGSEISELGFEYCGGIEDLGDYHEKYALDACLELLRTSTDVRHAAAYAVYLQENQK